MKANKSVDEFENDLKQRIENLSPNAPQYPYYISILKRLKATETSFDTDDTNEFDWED